MKKILLLLLVITAFFLLIVHFFSPHVISFFSIDTKIKSVLEDELGRNVEIGIIRIGLFPVLSLIVEDIAVEEGEYFGGGEMLKVGKMFLRMDTLPLLTGHISVDTFVCQDVDLTIRRDKEKDNIHEFLLDQAKHTAKKKQSRRMERLPDGSQVKIEPPNFLISNLVIRNALVHVYDSSLEDETQHETVIIRSGYFHNVGFNQESTYRIKCKIGTHKGVFESSGNFVIQKEDMFNTVKLDVSLEGKNIALAPLRGYLNLFLPCSATEGEISFDIDLYKEKDAASFDVKGKMSIQNCVFVDQKEETVCERISQLNAKFNTQVSIPFGLIEMDSLEVTTGESLLYGSGSINIKDKEFNNRFYSSQCNFYDVPFVGDFLRKSLPPSIVFNNGYGFDLFLKGDRFQQKIKGHVDFKETEIIVGSEIRKERGFPVLVDFDCSLENYQTITGPIDIELGNLTLKGEINRFNIANTEGEISFLTNKFPLTDISQHVISLDNASVKGKAKMSCTLKGFFTDFDTMNFRLGVTIDELTAEYKMLSCENINTTIAITSENVEVEKIEGRLNEVPVRGWFRMQNYRVNPIFNFDLFADYVDLDTMLKKVQTLVDEQKNEEQDSLDAKVSAEPAGERNQKPRPQWAQYISQCTGEGQLYIDNFIYRETLFEDTKFFVKASNGMYVFENVLSKGWHGNLKLSGTIFTDEYPFAYDGTFKGELISIEELLKFFRGHDSDALIDGSLTVEVALSGKGITKKALEKELTGMGSVAIRNGELKKIDLIKAISRAKQLITLGKRSDGTTSFSELYGDFIIKDGTIITENTELLSEDFTVRTKGELSFEGTLDYDLEIVLAPDLARSVLSQVSEEELISIPIHISGSVHKPRYSVTGALVRKIVDRLIVKGLNRFLKKIDDGSLPQLNIRSPQTTQPSTHKRVIGETEKASTPPQPTSQPVQTSPVVNQRNQPITGEEQTVTQGKKQDEQIDIEDVLRASLDLLRSNME